jgi:transposase
VAALVFMTRISTPWSLPPAKELGCGSATTCWRRLDEWARAGVLERLQAVLLDELSEAGRIDLERVSVDSFSLRAVKQGPDRRQSRRSGQGRLQATPGRRGQGLPLSVVVSAANANDSTMLEAVRTSRPL